MSTAAAAAHGGDAIDQSFGAQTQHKWIIVNSIITTTTTTTTASNNPHLAGWDVKEIMYFSARLTDRTNEPLPRVITFAGLGRLYLSNSRAASSSSSNGQTGNQLYYNNLIAPLPPLLLQLLLHPQKNYTSTWCILFTSAVQSLCGATRLLKCGSKVSQIIIKEPEGDE